MTQLQSQVKLLNADIYQYPVAIVVSRFTAFPIMQSGHNVHTDCMEGRRKCWEVCGICWCSRGEIVAHNTFDIRQDFLASLVT
jgi:hypothetical protein